MLTNFEIKPRNPIVTKSWAITIFTVDGFFIEQRDEGFSIAFDCSVPCQTCEDGEPTKCTSCNTLTGLNLFWEKKCYDSCPATTYYNASRNGCEKCNSNCLECSYNNGNECTSCDPDSMFPYLHGKVCKTECPFGFYEDDVTNSCQPCEAPC